MITDKTKKDFQKIIKSIREKTNEKNFPKPMMTIAQIEKKQATVNCGGEWATKERTEERANIVLNDERFKEFLDKYKATANLEINNFGTYQIRINFE